MNIKDYFAEYGYKVEGATDEQITVDSVTVFNNGYEWEVDGENEEVEKLVDIYNEVYC